MAEPGPMSRARRLRSGTVTVLSVLLLWVCLVAPDRPDPVSATDLLQVPLEALVLLGLVLVLPRRSAIWVAGVGGFAVAMLVLVKILDIGFLTGFYRPFDPLSDPAYLGSGWGLLQDSVGSRIAVVVAIMIALVTVGLLVLVPAAALRMTGVARRSRALSTWALALLAVVWVGSAALHLEVAAGRPIASAGTSATAVSQVRSVQDGLRDRADFEQAAARDPYAAVPPQDLLAGLRGKDVVVVFVESYGRVALQDPIVSPPVDAALDRAATQLGLAGYGARSAFLTSPTFGGLSWLAHSTLQTGLRISDQVRYNAVISGSRLTLASAFQRAGWRTVQDSPADESDFAPATSFYRYDTVYDARNVGYRGPAFGYAPIPDQYTLATLAGRELTPGPRAPVMAEVDLVSSHVPWAPLPHMVDPGVLGDGSVLHDVLAEASSAADVWRDPVNVRRAYGQSVAYVLDAVTSFVQTAHDDNLVVIMLGDHQPSAVVSGDGADHDVPVTVLAHDPAVLDRTSAWDWQSGWKPGPDAPVWPMEGFRDRLFTAFGG